MAARAQTYDDGLALGLLETHGLVAAIEAADAMVKASDVRLVTVEQTVAALMTVQVVGEVAAVQAAVEAGRLAAERVGRVVAVHVIPRPAPEVRRMQSGRREAPRASSTGSDGAAYYEAMTVKELRALARETPGFPLQGRDIARARKDELVTAFVGGA